MKNKYMVIAGLGAAVLLHNIAVAGTVGSPVLGSAQSFGVLAGSTATNTNPAGNLPAGPTTITGNVGVWSPGRANAITGLVSSQVSGTIYSGGAVPQQAQSDLTDAYVGLAAMAPNGDL